MTAVLFCHWNRIIHRDLKLENCLLDYGANVVHLGDFGSAMFEHDMVDVDGSVSSGSEAYAAPESFGVDSSSPRSSMRTDIWSLGILLYGMLTGDAPWGVAHLDHDETFAYYLRHGGAFLFEQRPEISDDVRSLLLGMLAVNPEERLDINEIMSHPWVARNTVGAPFKSTPPRAPKIRLNRRKPLSIFGSGHSMHKPNCDNPLR